jgi:hypothetical protein
MLHARVALLGSNGSGMTLLLIPAAGGRVRVSRQQVADRPGVFRGGKDGSASRLEELHGQGADDGEGDPQA